MANRTHKHKEMLKLTAEMIRMVEDTWCDRYNDRVISSDSNKTIKF